MHIALLDMGRATLRACGGVGFSVGAYPTVWEIHPSAELAFEGLGQLDDRAKSQIGEIIESLTNTHALSGASIRLLQHAPQHSGFGAKTSLILGLIRAYAAFHQLNLADGELQLLSGRGGTSGVGLHAAVNGGLIWDGGHRQEEYANFRPSSESRPESAPPLIARWEFPDEIDIILFLPSGRRIDGADEISFFNSVCPIPPAETMRTFFAVFHGVIPGILLRDISLMKKALTELHSFGFKGRELAAQSAVVRNAYKALNEENDVAVGLSSMGPLLYCLVPRSNNMVRDRIGELVRCGIVPPFVDTRAHNSGQTVSYFGAE